MKTFTRALGLALGMAASVGANASLLGLYGDGDTSAYTIPTLNDYGFLVGKEGHIGGHLFNTSSSSIQVTYEYLFAEAEFNNSFLAGGSEVFNTGGTPGPLGSSYGETHTQIISGLADLDFAFRTGPGALAENDRSAANQNNGTLPHNFFIYFDDESGAVYLALDDSGANEDDNHDDMIIRITAAEVPEPAAFALLGLGLLGAGVARRRK